MPELQSTVSLPWREASSLQNIVAAPWRDGAALQSLGSPYTPPAVGTGTPIDLGSLAAAKEIAPRTNYSVTHSMTVIDLRTGDPLPVESVTLTLDDGSAFWQLSAQAHFDAAAALNAGEQPAQVEVQINGETWRFVIESMSAPRSFASASVTFGGRSIAALADGPYQFARQWIVDAPTTAAQIATIAQTNTGLEVVWRAPDWLVPANAWSHQGFPFGVVAQCAEAIGGVVEAHQTDFSVTVSSRYPVMPNEWATTPPDVQVAWEAVESDSSQRSDQPAYNAVIVAGQQQGALALVRLAGTSGADQAPMLTGPLLTDVDALAERGRALLGASGKALTVQRVLQLLNASGEPGVIKRGSLVRWVDPDETWVGMVRSVSVRATLGEARQTVVCERRTEFPVGTAVPDAIPPPPGGLPLREYVISLALGDGANAGTVMDDDVPGNPDLVKTGSITTSTTVAPPFGLSSILFPGTTGNSSLAAHPVADWIGSGALDSTLYAGTWCIDAWILPTNLASPAVQCICGDDFDSGSTAWNAYLLLTSTGALGFNARSGGVGAPAGTIVQGVWSHVAVTGDGAGNYRLFVNGVHVASGTGSSYTKQNSGVWLWGEQNRNFGGFQRNFVGRMKGMRITWGHIRYPGTESFTPPTSIDSYV